MNLDTLESSTHSLFCNYKMDCILFMDLYRMKENGVNVKGRPNANREKIDPFPVWSLEFGGISQVLCSARIIRVFLLLANLRFARVE